MEKVTVPALQRMKQAGQKIVGIVVWDAELARVAEIVPEFASNGKDVVTVEQVLTHTGGFPLAPLGYPRMLDRQQRRTAQTCA